MLENILNYKKETKVAITTNINKDTKDKLKKFCKKNNIAINYVIETLLITLLENNQGLNDAN